jgi:hypothetical protein
MLKTKVSVEFEETVNGCIKKIEVQIKSYSDLIYHSIVLKSHAQHVPARVEKRRLLSVTDRLHLTRKRTSISNHLILAISCTA